MASQAQALHGALHGVYLTFCGRMSEQIAQMREAQVCQALNDQDTNEHLVRSPEFGINDLGVHCGDRGLLGSTTFERWFENERSLGRGDCIVPVDVKTFSPVYDAHGAETFEVEITPDQIASCQVLLVSTCHEPDYVAVVPTCAFPLPERTTRDPRKSKILNFQERRWQFTFHKTPFFPSECAPVVVPLRQLSLVVDNLRSWLDSPENGWLNPHTGVDLARVAKIKKYSRDALSPTSPSMEKSLLDVPYIYRAFRKWSSDYQVDGVRYCPLIADFKLVGKGSDQTPSMTFVELKTGHCKVQHSTDTGRSILNHAQRRLQWASSPIFSWRAQWDYLLTVTDRPRQSGQQDAYFIPRDLIPKHWWNASLSIDFLEWPLDAIDPDEFLVNWTNPEIFVSQISAIMARQGTQAQEMIPVAPIDPNDEEFQDEADVSDVHEEPQKPKEISRYDKAFHQPRKLMAGFGFRPDVELRGDTYQLCAAHALMLLCRQRGRFVVLDFGVNNDRCRFGLAPYTWSAAQRSRFDIRKEPPRCVWHFHKDTVAIPVSFLRLSWTHDDHPISRTKDVDVPGSLVIADVWPARSIRLRHARFIFPFEFQVPFARKDVSGTKKIKLTCGTLDQFQTNEEDMVQTIFDMFLHKDKIRCGRKNREVDAGGYIGTIEQILEHGIKGFATCNKFKS